MVPYRLCFNDDAQGMAFTFEQTMDIYFMVDIFV